MSSGTLSPEQLRVRRVYPPSCFCVRNYYCRRVDPRQPQHTSCVRVRRVYPPSAFVCGIIVVALIRVNCSIRRVISALVCTASIYILIVSIACWWSRVSCCGVGRRRFTVVVSWVIINRRVISFDLFIYYYYY